jgi:hypothetical protein
VVFRVVDRLKERVAAGGIAPQAVGNQCTITDSGRRNLPKFSGTRTLEAVNTFITAVEQELRVQNTELLRQAVDGMERTEGLATYPILQLENAVATWGKYAFPIGGPVQTWETF